MIIVGEKPHIASSGKNVESIQELTNVTVQVGGNATVIIGTNLKITCPVKGKPAPSITWYKQGMELRDGDNLLIDNSTRSLNILKVQYDASGTYQCVAKNPLGVDQMTTYLLPIGL